MVTMNTSMIPRAFDIELDGYVLKATLYPPNRIVVDSLALKVWLNEQVTEAIARTLKEALQKEIANRA
jgi:hypothetical protein